MQCARVGRKAPRVCLNPPPKRRGRADHPPSPADTSNEAATTRTTTELARGHLFGSANPVVFVVHTDYCSLVGESRKVAAEVHGRLYHHTLGGTRLCLPSIVRLPKHGSCKPQHSKIFGNRFPKTHLVIQNAIYQWEPGAEVGDAALSLPRRSSRAGTHFEAAAIGGILFPVTDCAL